MTTADTAVSGGSSSTSRDMRSELSDDAQRLKDTAQHRAAEEAETRKNDTARAGRSISAALDKAAGDLESDDAAPDWVSSAFRKTASSVERLSKDLEGRSAEDMVRQVRSFARENATAFLAASAAAGFAAARLLRAGSHHEDQPSGDFPSRTPPYAEGNSANSAMGFGTQAGMGGASSSDTSNYPIGGTRP